MNESQAPSIEILYELGAVFVLNKPGGLLTQAPPGIDSLEWRMKQLIKQRLNPTGNVYIGVPHRLDRPVSGAIVMVRNVRAAQRVSEQLQNRTVTKTYWAVVEGQIVNDQRTLRDHMRKLPDEAKSEIVPDDHPEAKLAILHYRVLGRAWNLSLIEIELETGRTHQIRLQLSASGHPIVGDSLYGSQTTFGAPTADLRKQGIALHARRLAFTHPIEHSQIDITAPPSDDWKQFSEFSDLLE